MSGSIPYQNRITKQYFNWQQPERNKKMEKTVVTNYEEEMDRVVNIVRTAKFYLVARQLSDFVKDLPLDQPTNDRLVALMVEQVTAAEHGAVLHGFRAGLEYAFKRHGARWTEGIRILEKLRAQLNKSGTGQVQKTDDICSE